MPKESFKKTNYQLRNKTGQDVICLNPNDYGHSLNTSNSVSGFHQMGGEHAMEQYKVCIGPNLTCMNDLLNRMGQFDHVDYKGGLVKCRSACEDQINSLFVTTSSYPNR